MNFCIRSRLMFERLWQTALEDHCINKPLKNLRWSYWRLVWRQHCFDMYHWALGRFEKFHFEQFENKGGSLPYNSVAGHFKPSFKESFICVKLSLRHSVERIRIFPSPHSNRKKWGLQQRIRHRASLNRAPLPQESWLFPPEPSVTRQKQVERKQ